MSRRAFITLLGGAAGAAAWPFLSHAQQPARTWRLAMLHPGSWEFPADAALLSAFMQQMKEFGYAEGKTLIVDRRAAQGRFEQLPALAAELVGLRPDVIVAVATPAIAAAQRATATIPIVMTPATDPIGSGFVRSLARPGGNITGLANMFGDLTAKSVEIVKFFFPAARTVAVLTSANPTHPQMIGIIPSAAHSLNIAVHPIRAAAPADLEAAFGEIERTGADALLVLADPIRPAIVSLAAAKRIPAIYQFSEFAEVGGLISYGPSVATMFRRSAYYVDRILKGASPAELPVEQPTTFELVLNLNTARSLGLALTESVISRADRVIE